MTANSHEHGQMITSTLRMTFRGPAHAEALQVLRALLGMVRSHPGCVATRLTQDVADVRTLTWVEQWRCRSDFERHLRSDVFRRLLAVMELAAEPPGFEVDEVSRRHGFELVETLLEEGVADPQ